MWPYWATGMQREGEWMGGGSGEGSLPRTTLITGHISTFQPEDSPCHFLLLHTVLSHCLQVSMTPSSHLCPSRFSPPIHRSGSLPLRLPLTVSPSLHPHLLTFISDLTPESLHGTFVYWQPVCVALRLYFLLAYHLLLSSADWMNPCF